jgi:hypothetical protein
MEADRYGAIVNTGHHKASRDDFTTPEAAAAWAREEAPKLQAQSSGWGAEWRVHRLVGSQSATQLHPSTCVRRSCDCTVKCGDDPDLPSGKAEPCLHLQQRHTAERVIEERQARIAELTHALGQPGDVLAALEAGVELQSQLLQTHAAKEGAYLERNRLVAALATCYPAGTAITPIEGWAPEFCNCVFIDLPTGQASWHYHDSQAHLFAHLPPYAGTWDGHTTEEKYERVARLAAAPQAEPQTLAVAPVALTGEHIDCIKQALLDTAKEPFDIEEADRIVERILSAFKPPVQHTAAAPQAEPVHPDDLAVDRFAARMKWKLAQKRNQGRCGWQDRAWTPEMISQALREHVEKGDPLDVANYCMFLAARNEPIAPASKEQTA